MRHRSRQGVHNAVHISITAARSLLHAITALCPCHIYTRKKNPFSNRGAPPNFLD